MKRSLGEKYEMGMIAASEFMIGSLNALDSQNPGQVLRSVPESILLKMLELANGYVPERMLTWAMVTEWPGSVPVPPPAPVPTSEQVAAAKRWIEESIRKHSPQVAVAPAAPDAVAYHPQD